MSKAKKNDAWSFKKMVPLIVIAIVAFAGAFFLKDVLNFEILRDNREILIAWRNSNFALVALIFVMIYVLIVAFSLPGGAVMTLTGGFLFGIFPGVLFNVTGATIGAVAIFLAAKTGIGDFLHKKLNAQTGKESILQKMKKGLHENEVSYLFLMRLVPAVPFFVANLAPAFLGVKLKNYILTTFFGIIPASIVYTSVGSGLGDVFAAGKTPDLGVILEPYILGPIIGLCLLATLPIVIEKFKKK